MSVVNSDLLLSFAKKNAHLQQRSLSSFFHLRPQDEHLSADERRERTTAAGICGRFIKKEKNNRPQMSTSLKEK